MNRVVLAFVLLVASRVEAQPRPLGPDFQVNSYTTGDQQRSDIAVFPDGSFVVTWVSGWESDPDTPSTLRAQRFASDGSPAGGEFQVETYPPHGAYTPRLAANPDGSFVVVWVSLNGSPTDTFFSIQAQRFDSDGSPAGDEFQVNSFTTDIQVSPAVASAADGSFVVVWESMGGYGSDFYNRSIQGQRFHDDGTPMSGQFQVNLDITGSQISPDVAATPDGAFVVVWNSGPGTDVQGRTFAVNGVGGGEFQVNSRTSGIYGSVAAAADGSFVVAWESPEIAGRRFSNQGLPFGDQFQVNSYTTGSQNRTDISTGPRGTFLVTWDGDSAGNDDSGASAQGRWLSAVGMPVGSDFQVNSYTTSQQRQPAAGAAEDGTFVVAWTSFGSSGTDSDS